MSKIEELYKRYLQTQQKIGDTQMPSTEKLGLQQKYKNLIFDAMQESGETVPKDPKILNFVKDLMGERIDDSVSTGQVSKSDALSKIADKVKGLKKEAIAEKLGPVSERMIDPSYGKLLQGTNPTKGFGKAVKKGASKLVKGIPVLGTAMALGSSLMSEDASAGEVTKDVAKSFIPVGLETDDLGPAEGSWDQILEDPNSTEEMQKLAMEKLRVKK